MSNKFVLNIGVLVMWMLCGVCLTASAASYNSQKPKYNSFVNHQTVQSSQSSRAYSWGYQPLHSVAPVYESYQKDAALGYQFQSTSILLTSDDNSPFGTTYRRGLRSSPWGDDGDDPEDPPDPDDNPTGVVDDPLPVGSPLILLLFAIGYIAVRSILKKRSFLRE